MPLRRREWLSQDDLGAFDLIFADAWPGKFSHLDEALSLLSPGGFYVIDDLFPQPTWPEGHQSSVDALVATVEARDDLTTFRLDCLSGLLVGVKLS